MEDPVTGQADAHEHASQRRDVMLMFVSRPAYCKDAVLMAIQVMLIAISTPLIVRYARWA